MRILAVGNMYPPHHLGGYELVMRGAVRHLIAAGHEVRVLTTDLRLAQGESEPEDPDVHRDLRWYWEEHDYPPRSFGERLAFERRNAAVLSRHCDEFRPDVVSWWAMGGLSLSMIRRAAARSLPSVALVHDDWLLYGPEVDAWGRMVTKRPWLRPLARVLTGSVPGFDPTVVSRWLFVSSTTRQRALDWGWALEHAEVAPSGIDTSYLGRPAPQRDWTWRLLYVGRIDERKGVLTTADALALLPDAATLTIVGDGDRRVLDALHERLQALGLDNRLRLLGAKGRDQLPSLYADADVVVFPVEWDEPWGLVPLEAMAIGRPVVATGRGGSSEYLRDDENCLLFPAGDAQRLADAVTRLAANAGLRRRLVRAGAQLAPRFTELEFNARVQETIESLPV